MRSLHQIFHVPRTIEHACLVVSILFSDLFELLVGFFVTLYRVGVSSGAKLHSQYVCPHLVKVDPFTIFFNCRILFHSVMCYRHMFSLFNCNHGILSVVTLSAIEHALCNFNISLDKCRSFDS
jgi:hypothetical protein